MTDGSSAIAFLVLVRNDGAGDERPGGALEAARGALEAARVTGNLRETEPSFPTAAPKNAGNGPKLRRRVGFPAAPTRFFQFISPCQSFPFSAQGF
jgi:hypothetical protein